MTATDEAAVTGIAITTATAVVISAEWATAAVGNFRQHFGLSDSFAEKYFS